MKIITGVCICFLLLHANIFAQGKYGFEPSDDFPFGQAHPDAPEELLDFGPLIGESVCTSTTRNATQVRAGIMRSARCAGMMRHTLSILV